VQLPEDGKVNHLEPGMEKKDPQGKSKYLDRIETHELLSTKLTPPRLHPLLVLRRALLTRLEAGMEQKLTLVSAPAGFGKTTLVSEWIAWRGKGRVAWVSLDPSDNDPVRFWRYLITACKVFDAGVSAAALEYLKSLQPPFQALLTAFINGMSRLPSKAILVLEDYHVISAPQVHEMLTFCLDHLSPTLHLVLLTRSDPPLPLGRLRARNELNELRAEDLRFSQEETREFLDQALPFTLAPEMQARLANRTEGWVAGLRLVALALHRQGEADQINRFLDTFAGSHRPVMDYFIGDVFNAQPEPLQQFMLQTSVLGRLTGSLCDAITGRTDSALLLEQMERDNLFLVSLDAAQQWYRFHPLFAEALQRAAQTRIGEARLRQLSQQASLWYEAHAMPAEAVEAALLAQDWPRAAALIERIIAPQLVQNEYYTLRRWIRCLPEEALQALPAVCII